MFLTANILVSSGCSKSESQRATGDELAGQLAERLDAVLELYGDVEVAVSVIDPSNDLVLHGNGSRLFHAASTMKVPVLIELFRQASLGRFSLDDSLLIKNEFASIVDGSLYAIEDDTDDDIYERLGGNMSLRDLAYRMITRSSNLATNILIGFVSADSVQATSERLGTVNSITLRGVEDLLAYEQGLSNRMTSQDLANLMEALRTGTAVSPESDAEMIDILLDQQLDSIITSGLPDGVRLAHKTGSITRIHHDAAIVYPPQGESFTMVIMTEGLDDQSESSRLITQIAANIYDVLR